MESEADDRGLLIFDGDCSFCRVWVEYWKCLTGEQVRYVPFQDVGEQFRQVSYEEFASAVKLILPDGEVRSGAHAVFTTLASVPGKRWPLWLYERIPRAGTVSEAMYGAIARHRSFAFQVTRVLWGIPVRRETYNLTSWLFLRLLGAICLVAFASFGVQAAGLIGSRGILPVTDFLRGAHEYLGVSAYSRVPTLLWFSSGDVFLRVFACRFFFYLG